MFRHNLALAGLLAVAVAAVLLAAGPVAAQQQCWPLNRGGYNGYYQGGSGSAPGYVAPAPTFPAFTAPSAAPAVAPAAPATEVRSFYPSSACGSPSPAPPSSEAIRSSKAATSLAGASGAAAISVNGKSVDVAAERKAFATVRRRWRKNDTLEVKLPFRDRTEAVDDRHTDTVALMRGPLMMVAIHPPDGMPELAAPGLRFAPFYSVRGESYTTYFKQPVV